MSKLHSGALFLLASILLGLLIVACGPETPTATPVPPAATNTAAPPTNTVPPPTATAVPATATSAAAPASAADQALIREAITATNGLKSYHAVIDGKAFTETVKVEGDFIAPDKAYVKGTSGNQQLEQLTTGGKTYSKDASGKWTILNDSSSSSGNGLNFDITSSPNLFGDMAPLLEGGTEFMSLGQDTMNGVTVRHFQGTLDAAAMMGGGAPTAGGPSMSLGTFDLWIDPSTKYIHKMALNLDLAPFIRLMMGMFGGLAGTPGPGTPTPTPLPTTMPLVLNVVVSKHNDPSITIPNPPADAVPAPTNTPDSMQATMTAMDNELAATATAEAEAVYATSTALAGSMGAEATETPESGGEATATTGGGSNTGPHHQVGESATVAGLKITVNSVKEVAGKDFFQPGDGKRFIVVDVTFDNTTGKEIAVSTLLEMNVQDADGTSYDIDVAGAQQVAGGKSPDGNVPAGGTLKGPIGYEVPKDAKGLTWTFKDFISDEAVTWDINP